MKNLQAKKNRKRLTVWAVLTVLVLIILLVFRITKPGSMDESFQFIALILITGCIFELWLILKTNNRTFRLAFFVGFFSLLLLGWVSGAVGIIGSENNPENQFYWGVPLIIFFGSFLSRLKPEGMKFTMISAAVYQFLIPVAVLFNSPEVFWGNAGVVGVFILNLFFSVLFIISALIFKRVN
ncbi:hypothetical protein IT568_12285 [bacterium]|nr:hypothetical protein [bacterium]